MTVTVFLLHSFTLLENSIIRSSARRHKYRDEICSHDMHSYIQHGNDCHPILKDDLRNSVKHGNECRPPSCTLKISLASAPDIREKFIPIDDECKGRIILF